MWWLTKSGSMLSILYKRHTSHAESMNRDIVIKETFFSKIEKFQQRNEEDHSTIFSHYWSYMHLYHGLKMPFYRIYYSFSCFLYFFGTLSVHSYDYTCMHSELIPVLLSSRRHREPARWIFPFALMHVLLMLQPLKKAENAISVSFHC